jgi:hypothetical protein
VDDAYQKKDGNSFATEIISHPFSTPPAKIQHDNS